MVKELIPVADCVPLLVLILSVELQTTHFQDGDEEGGTGSNKTADSEKLQRYRRSEIQDIDYCPSFYI